MDMDYNQFKLSKFVDDFLIDNINNLTSDFTDSESHIDKLTNVQYFPHKYNMDYNNLKIDDTGKYSITLPKKADHITRIIQTYCNKATSKKIVITDATAGVGGNVLSFCKHNFKVNAIEMDLERFNCLTHNINEYGYEVNLINSDYLLVYDKLVQDVIFVDPPWGGINYKDADEITLKLGDTTIEELCNNISYKKLAKLTVLKLPFNYNLNYIKSQINLPFTIFKLKKILLIVIFNM
jgi:hypothetical protein